MSIAEALLLLATGTLAGLASTVASVASIVSYPVLLAIGLPPLAANVTNTMSLVSTAAGSVLGARPELTGQRSRALRLSGITALGGAAGACALLLAPASTFAIVVPVLIAGASVLLLIQPGPRGLTREPPNEARNQAEPPNKARNQAEPGAEQSARRLAGVFAAAMYIGYFGAAGGVVLLAVLSTMFTESLIRINALKNVISGAANGVAAIAFALFAPVDWAVVPLMAAGFLIGGMTGPLLARRLPARTLRVLISACGLAMAVKLGLSAY
jgi:uncharacterized membrane protein YfcA